MQFLPSDPWAQRGTVDNGPGAALSGIGNVFGDPMQNALQQQKQALTAREIAGQGQLGSLFAHPGMIDNATGAAALANGVSPETLGQVFRLTNNLNGGVDSDLAARAATGIGAYNNTPLSQQRAEQAHMAETSQAANIAAASQLRTAGLEPVQVLDKNGAVGWSTKADVASGKAAAQGYQPLISPDMVKGGLAAHNLLPQPGGGAVAPQLPDAVPSDPSSPTASIASLLSLTLPQPAAPTPSGLVNAPPAPAANVGAPTADAMSDDQKQFLGLAPPAAKLELKQIGADTMGNPTYGTFDPTTGKVAPVAPQGAVPAGPAPSVTDAMGGLHGDQFLATLPPEIQPMVKGIAAGDILPPAATTRQGKPNPVLMAVTQYDPNFNAQNATARFAMAKAFSSGPQGQAISSAGAALGHLGDLLTAVPPLGNANSSLPGNDIYNAAKNAAKGGAAAGPLAAYDQVNHRLNGELEKYYTATGGTKDERAAGEALQSRNLSPNEIYASAIMLADNLVGKSNQYKAQYNETMGPNAKPIPAWSPQAQATLAKVQQMKDNFAKTGSYTGVGTLPGVTVNQAPINAPASSPVGTVKSWQGKSYTRVPGDEYDQNSWKLLPGGQ